MENYDLAFPGAAIDAILTTAYDLQNAGYIFKGSATNWSGTPTQRTWLLAPAGFSGYGFLSAIPKGSIGICKYNGSAWSGDVINVVTIDSTVTNGSTNAVSGDAVWDAMDELATGIRDTLLSFTITDGTASADQASKLTYDVKMTDGHGGQHLIGSFNILAATAYKAGLMSAEDKAKVDAFLDNLRSLSFTETTPGADVGTKIVETLKMTVGGVQEAVTALTILAATTSKAGLMSATDKAYIDGLPSEFSSISGSLTSINADISKLLAMLGYYECSTAAGTAAKTVSASGYVLTTGGCIRIKMANANTADNVTLNINSTGAKALYYDGAQASSSNSWDAGDVLEVYYDGTQYQCASGGGGGKFATGENVSDVSITNVVSSNSDALPTSSAVSAAIPLIARVGDNNHLVDFVDGEGNVIFYVDSSFIFHALGNTSDESDDDEIPSKGLVKALIEAAISDIPTGEGDVIVKEGDNGHLLDFCDESGNLVFYVDGDFTFHALITSLSFHLPDVINSYIGDTLQMFFYPMLLSSDYQNVGVNMFVESEALKCKSLKRYAEYAPTDAGTKTMKLNILDEKLGILAQKQVSVNVITPASPDSMKNILLIGDSETEGYVNNSTISPSADGMTTAMRYPYGKEMKRLLTSDDAATATAPAGLGLTNIQFVGHHATSGVRHEGYGGRSASWFMGTSSPFYINGAIDFNAYLAQDAMYDDTSHKGADFIYILLGANGGATTSVISGKLVIDASSYKQDMIAILNKIKEQLITGNGTYANPNLKVILLSYVICNPTGGAYHVLGQGEYGNGMRQALIYYQFHLVNEELAAMAEYSSFVKSEYVSFQIDSENAYAYINKQVNRYLSNTEKEYVENIHPNEIGYKMYGQAVARDLLSRI